MWIYQKVAWTGPQSRMVPIQWPCLEKKFGCKQVSGRSTKVTVEGAQKSQMAPSKSMQRAQQSQRAPSK